MKADRKKGTMKDKVKSSAKKRKESDEMPDWAVGRRRVVFLNEKEQEEERMN